MGTTGTASYFSRLDRADISSIQHPAGQKCIRQASGFEVHRPSSSSPVSSPRFTLMVKNQKKKKRRAPDPQAWPSMATVTVIPDSPTPPPSTDPVECSKVLFDYPGADVAIRSRDSQTFRVLKLYVIESSSVLAKLIQDASVPSGATSSANSQTQLPEVQLSESSAILSSLLTFVFPVTPILPSTLEKTMELLSVAQKYEMTSVLTHIRGSLSRQNPPYINPENAFLAYALAQRHGLREEATQAVRLTLKFVLAIETLEDKLAIMPGAYLHELWKYHQRVQAGLRSDLPSSGAAALLKGFTCSQHTITTGHPYWIELYIWSIIENPSRFDPIEFQLALARHTAGVGGTIQCVSCIHISVETLRTFWTTLDAAVRRCMEKASVVYSRYRPKCPDSHPSVGRIRTVNPRDWNEPAEPNWSTNRLPVSSRMLGLKWGGRHGPDLRPC